MKSHKFDMKMSPSPLPHKKVYFVYTKVSNMNNLVDGWEQTTVPLSAYSSRTVYMSPVSHIK